MTPTESVNVPGGGGSEKPSASGDAKREYRTVTVEVPEGSPLFPFDGRDPAAAEQYRIIRTKLLHDERQPRVIAVTSPQIGDGKTLTAVNLAAALSLKDEGAVLLIDGDCRRSSAASLLQVTRAAGLQQVLMGECPPEDAIVRLANYRRLHFLPSGEKRSNPAELLERSSWRDLIAALREAFSFILIDTPPAGSVADYELIQAVVDGVVLVLRPDHTHRARCRGALQLIPRNKLLGVVPNCVPSWFVTNALRHHEYSYYSAQK